MMSGFTEHLPGFLLQHGPLAAPWWQWLLLGLLAAASLPIGLGLARLTRRILRRVAFRTQSRIDDLIVAKTRGPLMFVWAIALLRLSLPWLGVDAAVADLAREVLHTGLLFVLLWALSRGVDVMREAIASSAWAKERAASKALIRLGGRIAKIAVLAAAAVTLLAEMGYPVASLLAGLGIGGIALALAAQKTVENLFGAFSLGIDRPFREGDFVRVEDFVGTVEAIGIRSTRFRTLDRTLISIPNGKLSEMRLESFSARDRIRLACTVGLVYETTAAQMRQVLAGLERVIREHPKIWPDVIVVRFAELADSSLNIEVMAWFETADWAEFQLIRQEVLLGFMDVVEKAGTSFAFPTRTVHLASS
ncbi:MAG: mechanosensitive ion channel family protein [Proteobacteria bacterium]|jgi:MscS family membrane protein|nr:mechanosensitive ion channel family protein [Pseudomonadota bacterium]